jgi:membrane associated rhomboid family serine protease
MLIPIGTNVEHKRYPVVTYVLIGLNLLVFAVEWAIQRSGGIQSSNELVSAISQAFNYGALSGSQFHIYSLITYQFMHASWMHIIGNMIFLLPFGKAVEDRMGHFGFALFYLTCGAFAGGMHALTSHSPVIGASGSVCAVTAAFIVLAPKTTIKVLLIFFIIGVYQIPSMLLVTFFVLFDVFSLLASAAGANTDPTAWVAHLAGYISGFSITFLLLRLNIIASSQFDLAEMLRQAKRRRTYRNVVANAKPSPVAASAKLDSGALLRAKIAETAATGSPLIAADEYIASLNTFPKLKLHRQTHVALANALLQDGRVDEGALVYERYLTQHSKAEDCPDVALLLAAKYTRELNNQKRASELLNTFGSAFSPNHQALVATLTSELHT